VTKHSYLLKQYHAGAGNLPMRKDEKVNMLSEKYAKNIGSAVTGKKGVTEHPDIFSLQACAVLELGRKCSCWDSSIPQ
jgi:hypothetical protein